MKWQESGQRYFFSPNLIAMFSFGTPKNYDIAIHHCSSMSRVFSYISQLAGALLRAGGWNGAQFNTGPYMHSKNWPLKLRSKNWPVKLLWNISLYHRNITLFHCNRLRSSIVKKKKKKKKKKTSITFFVCLGLKHA